MSDCTITEINGAADVTTSIVVTDCPAVVAEPTATRTGDPITVASTPDPCIPYAGSNQGTTQYGFIPCTVDTGTAVLPSTGSTTMPIASSGFAAIIIGTLLVRFFARRPHTTR